MLQKRFWHPECMDPRMECVKNKGNNRDAANYGIESGFMCWLPKISYLLSILIEYVVNHAITDHLVDTMRPQTPQARDLTTLQVFYH